MSGEKSEFARNLFLYIYLFICIRPQGSITHQ